MIITRIQKHIKRLSLFFLIFISLTFLSGCVTLSDPEASQEFTGDVVGVIDTQNNLGQTFVSRRSNLNGILLWLSSTVDQSGSTNIFPSPAIKVDLFHSLADERPIYSTSVSVPGSGGRILITIHLPNQKNPPGQVYYLRLSSDNRPIQVAGRTENAYPYGQAYSNGAPLNADIAFRLTYDYGPAAFLQDLKLYISNIWLALPVIILLWLPGWLLLDVSKLRTRFDLVEQTAISLGLSLALIPLLLLWTTVIHLEWSRTGVLFISGVMVVLLVIRLVYRSSISKQTHEEFVEQQSAHQTTASRRLLGLVSNQSFLFLLVLTGTIIIRLVMVRDLATPAWVDSVHHALITRLILENGSIPSTYLPYLNIPSTTYHPGFHSIAAFFTWLTQLDLERSLLILGQLLNAFAVFSVYLLTKTLTRSATASLFAAFITGFLTPMPAYYTSWGRYTELTGLLILPVVFTIVVTWQDHEDRIRTVWIALLAAIAAGGLFMIHYRVIVFLACLLLSYLFLQAVIPFTGRSTSVPRLLALIIAVVIISILLVLPWFLPTLKNLVIPKLSANIEGSARVFADFSWPYLTSALGKQAIVVAGLGFIWSILKKSSLAGLVLLWVVLLFFLANLDAIKLPGAFRLPGSGLITNISVEIILFLPISILGGYFLEQLLLSWKEIIPGRLVGSSILICVTLFSIAAYLGSRQLVAILNPVTILSRQADLPAIQWVNENIPENESIVLNPFAWGYGLYAGNDGGYWIEPLTGRLTLPPPVLYGLGPGYREVSQQSQQVIALSNDPVALRDYLLSQQVHYIFIGARGGVMPPEKLVSSGLFEPLYNQDGAWVLAVKP